MKKLVLALIVMCLVSWSGVAFAKKAPKPILNFTQFRMVTKVKAVKYGKGSPNALKTFAWGQPIFAYVKIKNKLPASTLVTFKWIAPDLTEGTTTLSSFPKNKKGWSPFAMNSQEGTWTVQASFENLQGTTITESRQFAIGTNPNPPAPTIAGFQSVGPNVVVNPEPMALILYGLGGLPIAAHLLRRRKTAA